MIIKSLLDTDFYTFTQMQFAFHRYPEIEVEYAFKCRTKDFDFSPFFEQISLEIDSLHGLRFLDSEISGLARLGTFQGDFLQFLKSFRLNPSEHITLELRDSGRALVLRIKGRWVNTIPYETPVLAIISEVCQTEVDMVTGWRNLMSKTGLLRENPLTLFEFGTRRRQSKHWQVSMFETLRASKALSGTSNVELGLRYGVPVIGTVAHQYFQVMQAMAPSLDQFLKFSLEEWIAEYPTECRATLTDIVGFKAFLLNLTKKFALHYKSFRHDSGDPYVFCDALIARLKELEVDPSSRIVVFSDSLTVEKGIDLDRHYRNQIGVNIAIGTQLTNDFGPQSKALSMVLKMVNCDGKPVAKLADDNGKAMCEDEAYTTKLSAMFPR